ncbi:vWA domain-containing protein [Acanthopleuribacter pedis]|uniref:VWA domain-containing protein n=1 Tax=Acanthopleuribacter pedis TaxID=442870 RepID=A0A8J7QM85_9BACT|nr:vWA domain-containing protein [Acanthopleuribacter pedis]MBO1320575.1 VWA domain-containing protein [Acanthopleuribacter pedis]
MALSWQTPAWWAFLLLAGLGFLALLYLVTWFSPRRTLLGASPPVRLAVLALNLAAFACLALSLFQPRMVPTIDSAQHHLTLLIDASNSMLRTPGGWPALRDDLVAKSTALVDRLPKIQREDAVFSLASFGAGTRTHTEAVPIEELPDTLRNLRRADLAAPRASHLDAGLDHALNLGVDHNARAILLYSDGFPTRQGTIDPARRATQVAVPIHTWTPPGAQPELAVRDLYLPPVIAEKVPTHLRANLRNQRRTAADTTVTLRGYFGEDSVREAGTETQVPADGWGRLRVPMAFRRRGVHYVDLTLSDADGKETHHRRVFAQVTRPPKYLAVGGDNRWVEAFPPDRGWVEPIQAEALTTDIDLTDFDAIIINDVVAGQFPRGALKRIADAVQRQGLGLFFINGDHAGAEDLEATAIMSYSETPIEPLLPVSTEPRPQLPEFSERHIVMMVDASGSMGGPRLKTAQALMGYIVRDLLGRSDRLDLIAFNTEAYHLVDNKLMTPDNKRQALYQINGIEPTGGTDPRLALKLIADRQFSNCGLIFISDGFFAPVDYRPDCRPTVFGIGQSKHSISPSLQKIADPIPVPIGTLPGSLEIPFFDPEERPHFYEREPFVPQRLDFMINQADRLPMPRGPLPGNAITKVRPEAALIAIRPKFTDPVLAYVTRALGTIGAFTSALPPARRGETPPWVDWFERVLPFAAFNRYHIAVQERGDTLVVELNLLAAGGIAPRVSSVDLQWRDRRGFVQILTTRKGDRVGQFIGTLEPRREPDRLEGMLEIREQGADALPRVQRLAMRLPRAGTTPRPGGREAEHFGVNHALLDALRGAGGGTNLDENGTPFVDRSRTAPPGRDLRHFFWLAACLLYGAAVAVRRLAGQRSQVKPSHS